MYVIGYNYHCKSHKVLMRKPARGSLRSREVQSLWSVALDVALEVLGIRDHKIRITANRTGFAKHTRGWCQAIWESKAMKEMGTSPYKIHVSVKQGLTLRYFVLALAHELEHARQYIDGELTQVDDRHLYKGVDQTDTEYLDKAHEVAARAVEEPIWELFVERCAEAWDKSIEETIDTLKYWDRVW